MTPEDEAWNAIEAKQRAEQADNALRNAAYASVDFIDQSDVRDLGIMTLRKAFELGYRQGWEDKN